MASIRFNYTLPSTKKKWHYNQRCINTSLRSVEKTAAIVGYTRDKNIFNAALTGRERANIIVIDQLKLSQLNLDSSDPTDYVAYCRSVQTFRYVDGIRNQAVTDNFNNPTLIGYNTNADHAHVHFRKFSDDASSGCVNFDSILDAFRFFWLISSNWNRANLSRQSLLQLLYTRPVIN